MLTAGVDPATGYRSYSAKQLRQLTRIVAIKDLGLTHAQARAEPPCCAQGRPDLAEISALDRGQCAGGVPGVNDFSVLSSVEKTTFEPPSQAGVGSG